VAAPGQVADEVVGPGADEIGGVGDEEEDIHARSGMNCGISRVDRLPAGSTLPDRP
jgi:hypothetical protein